MPANSREYCYQIVGKVTNNRKIVAYDIMDRAGKVQRYSKDDTFELVKSKKVINATAQIYQGKPIIRVNDNTKLSNSLSCADKQHKDYLSGREAIDALHKLPEGTPLKIKYTGMSNYMQTIYAGENAEIFYFFDKSVLAGLIAVSSMYFMDFNGPIIKLDDNDPVAVADLMNWIKNKEK